MTEPGKIQRSRADEPVGPKRKKGADSDAFKEMMKVGKVRETDPEEKKKGKNQAEAEEEFKAEQTVSGPPQQGLEASAEPSLYDAVGETEGGGLGSQLPPSSGGEPLPPSAPPSQPPPFFPPQSDEGQQPQLQVGNSQERQPTTSQRKKTEKSQAPTPPDKKEQAEKGEKKDKQQTASVPVTPQKEMTGTFPATQTDTKGVEGKKDESTDALFAQTQTPTTPQGEKKEAKKVAEEGGVPVNFPPGAWEATKDDEKKDKEDVGLQAVTKGEGIQPQLQPDTGAPPAAQAPPPSAPISSAPFVNLPPQVQALFEKMAGVMTVMDTAGIKETTINLNNPQFKNSVFFGTQIVITEYATAPKEFNIEMSGNQQAMNLMAQNSNELVAAFQAGNYNFKVHRVDTSYQPSAAASKKEAQRVKRKQAGGGQ